MEKKSIYSTSLIYFIVVCLFVLVRMLNHFRLFSFLGSMGTYIINGIMQIGILFLFSIITYKSMTKKTFRATFKDFNYKKISFKVVLIAIGLGVVIYFLNVFVSSFFYAILDSVGYESPYSSSSGGVNGWTLVIGFLFTAILPAICEENLNRGMLLNGTKGLGMKKCILLNGLMFGLLHLNIEQFFYATLIGFFLGFVVYVTESIYPCMIIHFMNNGIGVVLSFLTQKGMISGGIFSQLGKLTANSPVVGFLVMFIVLLVLVILLFVLTRMLLRASVEDSFREKQRTLQDLFTKFSYFEEVDKIQNEGAEEETGIEEALLDIDKLKDFIEEHPDAVVIAHKKVKMDFTSKALLIATIVLASIVTIFTFIWGVI